MDRGGEFVVVSFLLGPLALPDAANRTDTRRDSICVEVDACQLHDKQFVYHKTDNVGPFGRLPSGWHRRLVLHRFYADAAGNRQDRKNCRDIWLILCYWSGQEIDDTSHNLHIRPEGIGDSDLRFWSIGVVLRFGRDSSNRNNNDGY